MYPEAAAVPRLSFHGAHEKDGEFRTEPYCQMFKKIAKHAIKSLTTIFVLCIFALCIFRTSGPY